MPTFKKMRTYMVWTMETIEADTLEEASEMSDPDDAVEFERDLMDSEWIEE